MQVKDLQPFLADIGRFLETSGGGKSVAKDFVTLSEGLTPFAELKIPQLCEFLKQAEEYQRTGVLSSAKSSKRKPKQLDENKVRTWAQKLSQLKEDAVSENVTYTQIEAEVSKVNKDNTKPELVAIAHELGLPGSFKTKKDVKDEILRLISERKESHQRTQFGTSFSRG